MSTATTSDTGDSDQTLREDREQPSATADRVPHVGADVDEGEITGDASRLDTDVESRIDQAQGTADPSDAEVAEIERERRERLAPENRPANAEVDNSARDFDISRGQFTDHEIDESVGPFNDPTAPVGELEA